MTLEDFTLQGQGTGSRATWEVPQSKGRLGGGSLLRAASTASHRRKGNSCTASHLAKLLDGTLDALVAGRTILLTLQAINWSTYLTFWSSQEILKASSWKDSWIWHQATVFTLWLRAVHISPTHHFLQFLSPERQWSNCLKWKNQTNLLFTSYLQTSESNCLKPICWVQGIIAYLPPPESRPQNLWKIQKLWSHGDPRQDIRWSQDRKDLCVLSHIAEEPEIQSKAYLAYLSATLDYHKDLSVLCAATCKLVRLHPDFSGLLTINQQPKVLCEIVQIIAVDLGQVNKKKQHESTWIWDAETQSFFVSSSNKNAKCINISPPYLLPRQIRGDQEYFIHTSNIWQSGLYILL